MNLLQAESNKSTVDWNSDDYNYLAIGNSITIHPLNEYWWNECGMAATTVENDYVHLVASALDANYYAYNFFSSLVLVPTVITITKRMQSENITSVWHIFLSL